jgi:hypothetical protein
MRGMVTQDNTHCMQILPQQAMTCKVVTCVPNTLDTCLKMTACPPDRVAGRHCASGPCQVASARIRVVQ